MSEIAISLKNVSKCFRRYDRPVDRLKEILLPGKSRAQEFWALQDINLEVFRGETLGIVGKNGSGKSTLLQIVAGTLVPTAGNVHVHGRISALLELGSGFNPEFTGRQNVFFNGRILGLNQAEIEQRFDQIAAFADIGDFLDQPVKTYSSGMFVRLAFAVAVSVEPDILIVDEALAVGDIYFQQKCFERIRELQSSGTTILFVSHDSGAVYKLCSRAVLLETGNLILNATPKQIIDLYEAKLLQSKDIKPNTLEIKTVVDSSKEPQQNGNSSMGNSEPSEFFIGSSDVQVEFIRLLDEADREIDSIVSEDVLQISVGLLFLQACEDPHIGFKIRNRMGEVIFETNTFCMGQNLGHIEKDTFLEVRFKVPLPLAPGDYTIPISVADIAYGEASFKRTLIYNHTDTTKLKVLGNKTSILWAGVANLQPSFSVSNYSTLNLRGTL